MRNQQRQYGMSMFGIVVVLMIVGVLTATLAPMLLSQHTQSTEGSDRKALEAARTALVGYALSVGKLPKPVDATGVSVTTGVGFMPPSSGAGAIPALGVNNYGASGKENPFRMDVNDALALVTTSNPKDLCAVAQAQLATPAALPRICQDDACTVSTPVAFVLYSTGSDRTANLQNDETTIADRIYENDKRGINNSSDAGSVHYDDQLVSYPLSSLVTDCAKLGGVPVCAIDPKTQTFTLGNAAILTASCSNKPTTTTLCTDYTWDSYEAANPSTSTKLTTAPVPTAGTGGSVIPTAVGTYTYRLASCNELGTGPIAEATVIVTSVVAAPSSCSISPVAAGVPVSNTAYNFTMSCTGGDSADVNGYVWTLDGTAVGGATSSIYTTATGLSAGTHSVMATASNSGGTSAQASASLVVSSPSVCSGQTLNVLVTNTSGSVIYYLIDNGNSCTGTLTSIPSGSWAAVSCASSNNNRLFLRKDNACNSIVLLSSEGGNNNKLSSLDTNNDGVVNCPVTTTTANSSICN
ncbi:MAG: hypothetical protein U1C96_12495 [Gallionella sp.]|nr:hypothetical protein [Gallionella sp.]